MSTSAPSCSHTDLTRRLRTAGCVFAEEEARLLLAEAPTPAALEGMVARRTAGQPLEHVLGWAEFCGLRITVRPGVFVPRRRTEFLVEQATELAPPGAVVVDLCCGSGAIGAALAARLNQIELHATDLDPASVRCARDNITPVGQVHEGDLFEPLPATLRSRVNILVANTPYVPTGAVALMPSEARLHEPRTALDGGEDGLEVQRRVSTAAGKWLAPGGSLLMETSERQAPRAAEILTRSSLHPRVARSAEFDATVVIGTRPT